MKVTEVIETFFYQNLFNQRQPQFLYLLIMPDYEHSIFNCILRCFDTVFFNHT